MKQPRRCNRESGGQKYIARTNAFSNEKRKFFRTLKSTTAFTWRARNRWTQTIRYIGQPGAFLRTILGLDATT